MLQIKLLIILLVLLLIGGFIIFRNFFFKEKNINSKEEREKSNLSDKIAAFMFFILLFASVMSQPFFLHLPILFFPFIIYGLWSVLSKKIWVPKGYSERETVKPIKHFWHGREAVVIGGWFIFIGALFSLFLLYVIYFIA